MYRSTGYCHIYTIYSALGAIFFKRYQVMADLRDWRHWVGVGITEIVVFTPVTTVYCNIYRQRRSIVCFFNI